MSIKFLSCHLLFKARDRRTRTMQVTNAIKCNSSQALTGVLLALVPLLIL